MIPHVVASDLDLPSHIVSALARANYESLIELYHENHNNLCKKLRLNLNDVTLLINILSKYIYNRDPINLNEQLWKRGRLKFGDSVLDRVIGGIIPGAITEIVGESASGKTNLALQLCCAVQLPKHLGGLGGGAIYLCTEQRFPTERLFQLFTSFKKKFPCLQSRDMGSEVHVESLRDLETQEHVVRYQLPVFVRNRSDSMSIHSSDSESSSSQKNSKGYFNKSTLPIRLIIIDSIAAPFRGEATPISYPARSQALTAMSDSLKELAHHENCAVVCINQISDFVSNGSEESSFEPIRVDDPRGAQMIQGGGKGRVVPTLGLSWSNCINVRISLARWNEIREGPSKEQVQTLRRTMKIEFAPHWPNAECEFRITENGIEGVMV